MACQKPKYVPISHQRKYMRKINGKFLILDGVDKDGINVYGINISCKKKEKP